MTFEKLKEIGLTEGEIRVYESLLELGESTKTPIAERANVSPSKVYDILHRLMEKGIVSVIKRGNIQHFRAANPKRLRDYVDEKEKKVDEEKKIISDIMPSLLLKFEKTEEETDAEIFKGWKGLETVYNEIIETLNAGETNYVFGASKGEDQERTHLFFDRFNKKRHEKGIKIKIIFNEEARGNIPPTLLENKEDEVKYTKLTTKSEINIFKDKVVILVLSKQPLAVVIKNQKVAESFVEYFNAMWNISKE